MRPSGVCRPCALVWGNDAVAHLPCQVKTLAILFQPIHHTQALHIVVEAVRAKVVQCLFACVAKGSVPQIMRKADGLGQILVQAQTPGNGAGDLRNFQRMGSTGCGTDRLPARGTPAFSA